MHHLVWFYTSQIKQKTNIITRHKNKNKKNKKEEEEINEYLK